MSTQLEVTTGGKTKRVSAEDLMYNLIFFNYARNRDLGISAERAALVYGSDAEAMEVRYQTEVLGKAHGTS
jgi:hypothetical protein